MNAAPGWYQDIERPPGHLRYWDGLRWTEHRVVAPPPTGPRPSGRASWVARHKAWTAVLVVVLLVFAGSLLPEEEQADVTSASSPADEAPTSESSDQRAETSSDDRDDEPPVDGEPAVDGEAAGGRDGDDDGSVVASKPKSKPKPKPKSTSRTTPTFLVARVVDGDTVELGNGETVRLVGIDTPEVGECGFEAASANLARLVLGKDVQLAKSDEDRDGYGRLLRYVDVAGTDAGLRLIRNGRAIAAYDSRDGYGFHPREQRYIASDRGARNLCPMATGRQEAPEPAPNPAAKPRPIVGVGGGGGGNCATGYSPCVPAGPDLDCPDVDGPIRVTGSDPHGLDADGDGWACES